jgi:tetratricopeptide (TPR) repeat protein
MRTTIFLSLVAVLTASLTLGCEEDTQKVTLREARTAVKASQYDLALKKFKEFLAMAPDDYNGMWGMADVYGRQGNVVEQEKMLNQILSNEEYKKSFSRVLMPALEQNYVMQGNNLLGSDSKKAEAFYRKALTLNKKNALANSNLAELLLNRGDGAQKAKKYQLADDSFRAAIKLRIPGKLRKKLKKRAELSEFFVNRNSVMPRFEKVKKELVDGGQYDVKTKEFVVSAEVAVEGAPGKKNPNFEGQALRAAYMGLLSNLTDLTWKVAGKARPADVQMIKFSRSHLKGLAKNQKLEKKGRKKYLSQLSVRVARDVVLFHVIDIDEGRIKKKTPPPAPAAEKEAAPAKK